MFFMDVETLDLESTAVLLAVGIVHMDDGSDTENLNAAEIIRDHSLFVKFSVASQKGIRTINKDTVLFWNSQDEETKRRIFIPNEDDVEPSDGIRKIQTWMKQRDPMGIDPVYTRGMLDPMVFSSFCKSFKVFDPIKYNRYRDIRTAIDCLTGTITGYCESTVVLDIPLLAHDPVHDCVRDALMLHHPKTTE